MTKITPAVGDRVIIQRAKAWTVEETAKYAGHRGEITYEAETKLPTRYLVCLDSGPIAGECRWFSAAEMMTEEVADVRE
jgi:hypothetical protein